MTQNKIMGSTMKTFSFSRILMMSCGFAALAAPAFAQTAGGGPAVEEVVVTGSRIVRNGFQAPTPVTTLAADALQQRAPSNIPDALTAAVPRLLEQLEERDLEREQP